MTPEAKALQKKLLTMVGPPAENPGRELLRAILLSALADVERVSGVPASQWSYPAGKLKRSLRQQQAEWTLAWFVGAKAALPYRTLTEALGVPSDSFRETAFRYFNVLGLQMTATIKAKQGE